MRITELKEKHSINSEKAFELITFRDYVPIAEKYSIATAIADACLQVDQNGIYYIDSFQMHIAFVIKMITSMTNIEINPDEAFDAYDFLVQSGYLGNILEVIHAEYEAISDIMNGYVGDKLSYENSTAKILADGIAVIYGSIYETGNTIMDAVSENLNKLDIEQITKLISTLK